MRTGRLNALPCESKYGLGSIKEEMIMRSLCIVAALALLSGCAEHRLIVPRPNPTGAPITVNSDAFAFGTVQRRNVVKCDTNIIDEVRVNQKSGPGAGDRADARHLHADDHRICLRQCAQCLKAAPITEGK